MSYNPGSALTFDSRVSQYRQVRRVLIVVLALNLTVAAAKLVAGSMAGSLSMVADGFHSLLDSSSNVLGLVGTYLAYRPPDESHPYGHKKFETFAALGIALLLMVTSGRVIAGVLERLSSPLVPEPEWTSYLVMAATIAINVAVSTYEMGRGLRLQSDVLMADALQTRSDILVSASVVASLAAVSLGYPVADIITSLGIAGVIAWTGLGIIRRSSAVLLDASTVSSHDVEEAALEIEGVEWCHGVRSRGRPDQVFVDLHVGVNPTMSVREAHDIAERVAARVKARVKAADVVVHVEPSDDPPEWY